MQLAICLTQRRMAYFDGSTLVAKYLGQNLNLFTTPLEKLPQRSNLDCNFFMKDVLKNIAFVHARGLSVGAELLSFEHIFVADSTEGPKAILTIQKEGSSYGTAQDDIRATGRLFSTIWANYSWVPDLLQNDLIMRMSQEDTRITAAEASHHFAFWSSCRRLSFLKKVSDILELKQKSHMAAVEAKSRWVKFIQI